MLVQREWPTYWIQIQSNANGWVLTSVPTRGSPLQQNRLYQQHVLGSWHSTWTSNSTTSTPNALHNVPIIFYNNFRHSPALSTTSKLFLTTTLSSRPSYTSSCTMIKNVINEKHQQDNTPPVTRRKSTHTTRMDLPSTSKQWWITSSGWQTSLYLPSPTGPLYSTAN